MYVLVFTILAFYMACLVAKLSCLLLLVVDAQRKQTVGFKCPSSQACRHLWRCAVEQRIFFT